MARLLASDEALGIRETVHYDDADDAVTFRHSEDVTPILDHVARVNAAGGPREWGAMRLVAEVPVTVAMEFCRRRGIPWAAFAYRNDYNDEFRRFCQEHPKLVYEHKRKQFSGVSL